MNHLLVIGGASLDVLHLKDKIVNSPGGAGMYTAMAARRCGAQATLFAPRPDPCPASLLPKLNICGHPSVPRQIFRQRCCQPICPDMTWYI